MVAEVSLSDADLFSGWYNHLHPVNPRCVPKALWKHIPGDPVYRPDIASSKDSTTDFLTLIYWTIPWDQGKRVSTVKQMKKKKKKEEKKEGEI